MNISNNITISVYYLMKGFLAKNLIKKFYNFPINIILKSNFASVNYFYVKN